LNEIQNRKGFLDIGIILVSIVMEGDIIPIIGIDARSGNHRAPEIAADIFHNGIGVAYIGLGINIKSILVLGIDEGLCFFEGRADALLHFTQQGGLESLAQISVIKIGHGSPKAIIREAAFRQEAMDMRVP